jgi:hypothetical protein
MSEGLNLQELFARTHKSGERFDDDWVDGVVDLIRTEGVLVGRHEWDSGGPGAGAGTDDVYNFRGMFISEDDAGSYGPFDTFEQAAEAIQLFSRNEATTDIWVDPRYRELLTRSKGRDVRPPADRDS